MALVEIEFIADAAQADAEARKLDKSLDNIGKQGNAAGAAARQGFTNMERAAQSATATIGQNKAAIAAWDKEIGQARAELALMSQRLIDVNASQGRGSNAAKDLRAQMAGLAASTRGLVAEKALLVTENKALEAAETASTGAFARKTTMINTGQGALRGYDAAITGVIRSLGGIQLGWAVLISLGASVLPMLLKLGDAKREQIDLDEKLIAADIAWLHSTTNIALGLERNRIVQADLTALLKNYLNTLGAYTTATKEAQRIQGELNVAKSEGSVKLRQYNGDNEMARVRAHAATSAFNDQQQKLLELTQKRQQDQAAMHDQIEGLIRFAIETGRSTQQIVEMAGSLGADAAALRRLEEALSGVARAQREFNLAVSEARIPAIQIGATMQGEAELRRQLIERIQGQAAAGLSNRDIVIANRSALEQQLRVMKEQIESEAAVQGRKLSHAEAQRQLNARIREAGGDLDRWIASVKLADENQKAWTASIRSGEAAARALALATSTLAQEAREAMAATQGRTFEAQAEQVRAEIDHKREALAINKQLTEANSLSLHKIEMARLAAITNAELRAREEVDRTLQRRSIELIQDEYDRRRKMIDANVEDFQRSLVDKGLSEASAFTAGVQYRRQEEEKLNQWVFDRTTQNHAQIEEEVRRHARALTEIQTREAEAAFARQFQAGADRSVRAAQFGQQFGVGNFRPDITQIEQLIEKMDRLGITTQDVVAAFGRASTNVGTFNQQVRFLAGELTALESVALGFQITWEQFVEDWIRSGRIFAEVGDAISKSLEGMVAHGESFGANMKALMLNLLADIAEYWGRSFIALGAGWLFINPAAGAGLIAAGVALMALSGVLRGLASKAQQAARGGIGAAGTAGAGGGGSTAAAGGGGATSRTGSPPRQIEFPTSGAQPFGQRVFASGPSEQHIVVNFMIDGTDASESVIAFLEGKRKFLTVDNMRRQNFKEVRKTVRAMNG